ncbi:MAG: exodeoxyribonuclease VII small subunit [Firmicutes bacterium]|nr:exodeoxyribonuclease VII small subunit [Bacillota bacterium]
MSELTYEQAIQKLEEVVRRLENEEVPLEEALESFKEGVRLSRYCREKLAEIEFQVEYLLKEEAAEDGDGGGGAGHGES